MIITIFNWGRNNHLTLGPIVDDYNWNRVVGYWFSGRIFGKYVSLYIPLRRVTVMRVLVVFCILLIPTLSYSQDRVVNPTRVIFQCNDNHEQHTAHEIDILAAGGAVVQTILAGSPAKAANGDVTIDINVQPVKFGSYTIVVRAVVGSVKSANSLPSDLWDRSPGSPSKPTVQ